jgi:hypothetical protein
LKAAGDETTRHARTGTAVVKWFVGRTLTIEEARRARRQLEME